MKKTLGIRLNLLSWLICGGAALAAPPSDESLEEMMTLANVHQILDSVKGQMDGVMKSAANQATQGQYLTPERQAIVDRMIEKMAGVTRDSLDWDALKPIFLRVYRQSLTQEDVDGMIAFYKTPAGQAMISKMPLIMQNLMGEMMQMLKPMQEKMLAIQHETIEELKKTKDP